MKLSARLSPTRTSRHRSLRMEPLESRQLLAADIAGAIYNDLNADGIRDQGEGGLANWTVFLDLDLDGALTAGEPSTTTDADGAYLFSGLVPADYRVAEVVRSGWTPTNPATGFTDVTARDNETTRADFLNQGSGGTGVITGNVWRDLNADGVKDPADTGVAGWTVFLDLNNDKILDPDEPFELTDGNGDYTFTGILGGGVGDAIDYEVQEILTPGWEPAPGFSENYTAAVVEGQTTVVHDFANAPVEVSRVTGTVWNDLNGNGLREGAEPGLAGWTVYVDLNTNGVLDAAEPSTTTGGTGIYSLFGLEPGTHRIAEVQHIEFKPTSPSTGYQTVVAPNSGTRSNVNFGNQLRTEAAIGGVVYVDRDKDAMRDPGEEGLSGITVYIDGNDNGTLDTGELSMLTASDLFYTPDLDEAGTYRFDHLPAGTYIVRQIVPTELNATPESQRKHTVTVGPADDRSDVDFGAQYRASEIHGFKFEDVDGDHVRDPGEPGIEGVTIFIDLDRDNVLDAGEPTTVTLADGSYSFVDLESGAYVVREVIPAGFVQTFPETEGGILWPSGVSNPAVGAVSPTMIQTSLAQGDAHTETVSLTLPNTGALTNMVDVFLLFDDTGSFTFNSPIVRAAFPDIIAALQTQLPGIDLGFGVGRLEEYGNFAAEYSTGRPFVLNQPIIAADVAGFAASIQAGLDHTAPGYGGDRPETVIEALYQMVTGAGFDGNNNGSLLDSGPAGLMSTQVSPGNSGDVPPFSSFTADPANGVLPASGSIGGAGFRSGALPIIITATDTGFAYQPKGESTLTGVDGLTLPLSQVTYNGRGTTPFNAGAGVQETVTGLNALGALVIGLGTNDSAAVDPRIGLEALANLTGAINRTTTSIPNGTADPIDPGDPFYFKIGSGGDPLVMNIADGIVAAIEGAVTAVNVNVTLRASDPRVHIDFTPGVINGLGAGDTATFDVTFTGDGRPHRFDLLFVREGTDVVLGSIPVVLGTPIEGDGYEFEDCDDGEHSEGIDFGNRRTSTTLLVAGELGDDVIDVTPGTGGAWHQVSVNGVLTTHDPAMYGTIQIDGLGGNDRITIHGTDQNETVTLAPGSVDIIGATYQLHALNTEDVTVEAGLGSDEVAMTGSAASNRLGSYAGHATLADSVGSFRFRAEGFETVSASAPQEGQDYAFFYDSPQNDDLDADPTRVVFNRSVGTPDATATTATGFSRTYIYATGGGTDSATLAGSLSSQNRFYSHANYSILTESHRSFYIYARNFDTVTAGSSANGYAYFYDSPGMDAFTATPTSASMDRAAGWSDTTANDFARIYAYSTRGGDDTATLAGSATGGNQLRSYPSYATLTDTARSFYHYVRGFRSTQATGSQTDTSSDRAYLYDSSGADMLVGRNNSATLRDTAGASYRNEALYFDFVYARSSDGSTNDTVDVDDSLVYHLIRSGTW